MPDDAREVKSRVDIVEIIGDYVPLRRSGQTHWGLCPFHSEKTPSFSVSQERQTFHCFGCGKGGDVFSFLMEMEGLSFREVLEQLAARVGVTLSAAANGRRGEKRRERAADLRTLLEEAQAYFVRSLTGPGGEAARAYLGRRALDAEACRKFGLGWAPSSWDALSRHLLAQGYRQEQVIEAGLAAQGDRGAYDRFRGRLMFPVRDEMAKLAGFGGRLIDGEGAKYVNSPEGSLFNKRKILYLLHEAKRPVRERGRVILVEGYMDAIRAHLTGYTETVASLGTSLTEEQAALIKRFSDLCYIAYDADGAGQEAAIRGMYILQRGGVDVRVISLPQDKDPDDVLSSEEGRAAFEQAIQSALPLPLYHVRIRMKDLRTPGRELRAREELLSGLASLPLLDVKKYVPKIAQAFGVVEHELDREMEQRRRSQKVHAKSANYAEGIERDSRVYIDRGMENMPEDTLFDANEEWESANHPEDARTLDLECACCSLLWQEEALRTSVRVEDVLPLFSDEAVAGIVSALLGGDSPEELERRWSSLGERRSPALIARGNAVVANGLTVEQFEGVLKDLRRKAAARKYEPLKRRLLHGEATEEEQQKYHEWAKRFKGGVA